MSPSSNTTSIALSAPALKDLFPQTLSGEESLNALGSFTLTATSADALGLENAIASHVTLTLQHNSQIRNIDGLCAEIRQLPADATAEHYSLNFRPWLWWLSLAHSNRVFQNQSVPEIVQAIFDAHGYSDYALKLEGAYAKHEYCMQYGESDLSFVQRLLEEAGVFWFFTHEAGKHTLILGDSNHAFPDCPHASSIPYLGQKTGERELHGIRSAALCRQAVAGSYQSTDYEFTTPAASLYTQAQAEPGSLVYDEHPGGYMQKSEGDALAKQRIDGLRCQTKQLIGNSDCRWLIPGHCFTLTGHDDAALNIAWVLTSVSHQASHEHYHNQFTAIPKTTAFRPQRTTPKPHMSAQTALVVGKSGEEIWTDKYGRIKIQFPWQRDGKKDETSSCWVRVMQAWGGKGFGTQFIPRIGQEVVVTFMDNDPCRPLVTGCVYNGENSLPFDLPANQTQSGIKTSSSKGGEGFNALRFDDHKDNEEVFLQAQKDFNLNVLNDAATNIGHDETLTVKNQRTHTVQEGDDALHIEKGSRNVEIKTGGDTLEVKDKRIVKVQADQTHETGGNYEHKVSGNFTLNVQGDLTIKVSGTLTLQSKGAFSAKSNASLSTEAGTSLTHKAGTSLTNQSGTSLENKAGTTLTNDAGISLTNKASASQTIDGGAMLTLKGGIIQQN